MAHPRFRFEQILKHKQRMENVLEEALVLKEHEVRQAERHVHIAQVQVIELENKIRTTQSGGRLHLDQLLGAMQRLSGLRSHLKEKESELDSAVSKRDEARRRLVEAMKERKMFEQLKEKSFQRWQLKERQKEQRLTDEIAQRRSVTALDLISTTSRRRGNQRG